jgi:hypothetical protein
MVKENLMVVVHLNQLQVVSVHQKEHVMVMDEIKNYYDSLIMDHDED